MTRKIKTKIAAFVMLIFPAISVCALAGSAPDTNQTRCCNAAGDEMTRPQPAEAFYDQDAQYTINPPSYTKLDARGNDLPDDAASWVMVRDNVTGLIWEVKTDDDTDHDKDNKYTWYDGNPETNGGVAGTPGNGTDTEDFINALNSVNFGGYSDWRLPSRKELRSIIDYRTYNPAIDTAYFPNTVSSNYWSSTTYAYYRYGAWLVSFSYGYFGNAFSKSYSHYVRAVRSGQ